MIGLITDYYFPQKYVHPISVYTEDDEEEDELAKYRIKFAPKFWS